MHYKVRSPNRYFVPESLACLVGTSWNSLTTITKFKFTQLINEYLNESVISITEEENAVLSPYSVGSGLHSLLVGAGGSTHDQISQLLLPPDLPHLFLEKMNSVRESPIFNLPKFVELGSAQSYCDLEAFYYHLISFIC